jgi:hypothetical protein
MDAHALNEATRGSWNLAPRRVRAKFAMAIFNGDPRYVRDRCMAPRRFNGLYNAERGELARPAVWEFVGHDADATTRGRYVGGSVTAYFRMASRVP